MKKNIKRCILLLSAMLTVGMMSTAEAASKKYIYYEDFNSFTTGTLPKDLKFEQGAAAKVEKVEVDAENGDYAMKLTSGTDKYVLGMRLSEIVEGAGVVFNNAGSDRVTIEFDLKNENGGWGLTWLTEDEVDNSSVNLFNKVALKLANTNSGNVPDPQAATGDVQYWRGGYGIGNPSNGAINGQKEYSITDKWIHVKMELDGMQYSSGFAHRMMYAKISWYDKEEPEQVYSVENKSEGNGYYVETPNGPMNTSIRQKNIAAVGLAIAAASNDIAPVMEIDNLAVSVQTNDTIEAPITENVDLEQNGSKLDIVVNFSQKMRDHVKGLVTITKNGTKLDVAPTLSSNGKKLTFSGVVDEAGEYAVSVSAGAVAYNGGMQVLPYSFEFECDANAEGILNLVPIVTGAEATLSDGTTVSVFENITPYISSFKIKFANEMADDVGDYITVTDGLSWTGTLAEDKKSYTMIFNNVEADKEYVITVPQGTPSSQNVLTKADASFTIKTNKNDVGTEYKDLKLMVGDDERTGLPTPGTVCSFSTEMFKTSSKAEKSMIMICQYKTIDGYEQLVDVKFVPMEVGEGAGRDDAKIDVTVHNDANKMKAYIQSYPEHKIIQEVIYE